MKNSLGSVPIELTISPAKIMNSENFEGTEGAISARARDDF